MALQQIISRRLSNPPITASGRRALIAAMFTIPADREDLGGVDDRFGAYFTSWFEDQCGDATGSVSKMTIGDMLGIITLVSDNLETRETIQSKVLQLHQQRFKETEVDMAITLAARLWSISYIDGHKPPFITGKTIDWRIGSLNGTLAAHFQPLSTDKGKLPSFFTAEKIDRIAGIQILWTGNLLDHLRMINDDKAVYLFHQVSFLAIHGGLKGDGLPPDLVKETIRTLALLLPGSTKAPNKWYRKKRKGHEEELDPCAGSNGHLNASQRRLEEFKYWGERLGILKQAFDDSEPPSMWHWWRDDRKKVQWYTFWIATLVLVLTVVFGLIQSITGIIQTVLTAKSSQGH